MGIATGSRCNVEESRHHDESIIMLDQQTADAISAGIGTVEPFVAPLNPLIPLVLSLVGQAIKQEPKIEAALRALFSKQSVTPEDFDAAIAHIEVTTYEKLVPNTALPRPSDEGTVEGTLAAAKEIVDSGVLDRVMSPADPTKPNL